MYQRTIFLILFLFLVSFAHAQERGGQVVNKYKRPAAPDLIWDNTPVNGQVDNPAGTWNVPNLTWTHNGELNIAWIPRSNAIFGGTITTGTAATVTLTGTQQIGNVLFDTIADGNFLLSGGILNLNNTRSVFKNNASASITSVISGPVADTIFKTGDSTLVLNATNTYAGPTIVDAGTLKIGVGTSTGSIAVTSPVSINANATMYFDNNNDAASKTLPNPFSNNGTLYLKGYNASTAAQNGIYILSGNSPSFSGVLQLDRSICWGALQPQFGSSLIKVGDRSTITFNGDTFSNNIIIEDYPEIGWHHNAAAGDLVLGAIRLENTNILNGNITLNSTASVILGDVTSKNSTIGGHDLGNHTLNGVISGPGDLAMSRYTSYSGGSVAAVDIILAGTSSNTYGGKTVISGQSAVASLRLQKTGGAVAIPGNSIVWLGTGVPNQANLRMGDVTTTGAARNQWDNQFGPNVLMQFNNVSGQWMRFDLQGTNQTLEGLNAGTLTTLGGAFIDNQNINEFSPGNPATLTLTGSGNYVYNGYFRDAENGSTTNKLHLIKNGTGKQTLAGTAINANTGTTTINSGTLVLHNAYTTDSPITLNAAGTLELTGTAEQVFTNALPLALNGGTIDYTCGGTSSSYVAGFTVTNTGSSIINIAPTGIPARSGLFVDGGLKGTGTITVNNSIVGSGLQIRSNASTFSGHLIVNGIASTTVGAGSGIGVGGCTTGLANANITLNGTMELLSMGVGWANLASGAFSMGALNGSGVIVGNHTIGGVTTITMGNTNANGNFSGIIANGTGNTVNIIKRGTGTQIFTGNNTYTGTTIINDGALTAGSGNAFGTGIITVNIGGTLNKGGFSLPNIILNLGGTVNP